MSQSSSNEGKRGIPENDRLSIPGSAPVIGSLSVKTASGSIRQFSPHILNCRDRVPWADRGKEIKAHWPRHRGALTLHLNQFFDVKSLEEKGNE